MTSTPTTEGRFGAPSIHPTEITASRRIHRRTRGFRDSYRPSAKTRALLADVDQVLHEYRHHLPLTIRQIYYRIVGAYSYPKTEAVYESLCNHLNEARRGQRIAFDALRDDGVSVLQETHYQDADHFVATVADMARTYQRNKLVNQRARIEVWCEAAGMMHQLGAVANPYSIPVYSCSGFDSTSARYDIAQRIVAYPQDSVILHLGDADPSGDAIFTALSEDVKAFVERLRYDARQPVRFTRVALTLEQIRLFRLPTDTAKLSDSRTRRWAADRGSDATCQLEALPPNTIAGLLEEAIGNEINLQQLAVDIAEERNERQRLAYLLTAGGAA
jgi:hypothetical protein